MTARSGHASTPWPDAGSLAPQQRMEAVIGHLVDKAGALQARVVFTQTVGTLEADYQMLGGK